MDLETARTQMIGNQLRAWQVLDERVIEVMSTLPRERFVPPEWQGLAYADAEIPLGSGKRLAPPKIQGRALQALLPRPEETALEIGSGTGYLTACLARLCARVTGIEIRPELAAAARRNLASLDIDNVEILEGDGLVMEFPTRFDVICVNGSLPEGDERLQRRLTIGGRLFVVTGKSPVMQALRLTRMAEAEWTMEGVFETCIPPLENARQTPEFVF
jgi:protein-L-isoaspartate(D-aspartate) O-methyltransferase